MSITSERKLYILIDDDETNNTISRLLIANTVQDAEIITFENPHAGLHFVRQEFATSERRGAILLVNLNMPLMSGWDFIDNLMKLDRELSDRLAVYILTSSIDPSDRKRAGGIEIVRGFLDKPLSYEIVRALR